MIDKKPLSKNKQEIMTYLKDFLEENQLVLVSSFNISNFHFEKMSIKNPKTTEWMFENYQNSKYYNVPDKRYFEFIQYLLDKNQDKLALLELNAKNPSKGGSYYSEYQTEVFKVLKDKPDILFNFVIKKSFLDNEYNWAKFPELFKIILDKDKQEAILDYLISSEEFQNPVKQAKLYVFFKPLISEVSRYQDTFKNYIVATDFSQTNFVENVKESKIVTLVVSAEKLSHINPEEISRSTCIDGIKQAMRKIDESPELKAKLNIEEVTVKNIDHIENNLLVDISLKLSFVGPDVQAEKLETFVNKFLEVKIKQKYEDYKKFSDTECDQIFKAILKDKLEKELPNQELVKIKSLKI